MQHPEGLRKARAYGEISYRMARALFGFLADEHRAGTLGDVVRNSLNARTFSTEPDLSFSDLLEQKSRAFPGRTFLHYQGRAITFGELNADANRVAHALLEQGVQPGEGVAICMGNSPAFLQAFYGTQKLGVYTVPVNTALKGDGLAYILSHSDVQTLFLDADTWPAFSKIRTRTRNLRRVFVFSDEAERRPRLPKTVREFSALLGPEYPTENPCIPFDRSNLCIIMYTSGTTGPPKGVAYRFRRSGVKLLGIGARLLYTHRDRLYTCLPLFHANALWLTVTQAMWVHGEVVLAKRFSASRFWKDVATSDATGFNSIGAMIPILLKQPAGPWDRAHRVTRVVSAACPAECWRPFEERFGVTLWEAYGAVDGGGNATFNFGQAPVGSIGKPMFTSRCRVVNDRMEDQQPGEPGELIFEVRQRGSGEIAYYKNEKSTREKVHGGYLHTGDLVYRDEQGYLYFVGRNTESMRVKGENVSAYEVEKAVLLHPDILECAAYPIPSDLAEDDIMISVVPVAGATVDPSAVFAFLADHLPRFAHPRYLRVVSSLPKTATHRVIKKDLEAEGVTEDTVDRLAQTPQGPSN